LDCLSQVGGYVPYEAPGHPRAEVYHLYAFPDRPPAEPAREVHARECLVSCINAGAHALVQVNVHEAPIKVRSWRYVPREGDHRISGRKVPCPRAPVIEAGRVRVSCLGRPGGRISVIEAEGIIEPECVPPCLYYDRGPGKHPVRADCHIEAECVCLRQDFPPAFVVPIIQPQGNKRDEALVGYLVIQVLRAGSGVHEYGSPVLRAVGGGGPGYVGLRSSVSRSGKKRKHEKDGCGQDTSARYHNITYVSGIIKKSRGKSLS